MRKDVFRQRHIREEGIASRNKGFLALCLRHQRGALCNVDEPLMHIVHQSALRSPERIPDLRAIRYNIGCLAAVCDHVLNPARGLHVLAQIIGADVHQLHRVQRAPPVPRVQTRMGGFPGKREFHAAQCNTFPRPNITDIIGMPGKRRVAVVKKTVAGHQDLSFHSFLRRAAVKAERTGKPILFHYGFERQCRTQHGSAQRAMTAGVTGSTVANGTALRASILRKSVQRVIFGDQADHRLSAPPFGDKGCRNTRGAGEDAETILFQHLLEICAGAFFVEGGFGEFPYCIICISKDRAVFIDPARDPAENSLFHIGSPSCSGEESAAPDTSQRRHSPIFYLAALADFFCQRIGRTYVPSAFFTPIPVRLRIIPNTMHI